MLRRRKSESTPTPQATGGDLFLARHLPGVSEAVVRLREVVTRLNLQRNRDLVQTVLITGESGAGKNHLARVIAAHRRWLELKDTSETLGIEAGLEAYTDRFAEIHLPALPDQLVESELFGHRRGAFTGADRNRFGLLDGEGREAEMKDILLDEIGDVSAAMQAKLLAVVETRKFRPLGASIDDERETSARFIFATNTDLVAKSKSKAFREDLLWRLRQFHVVAPALREQPENIEAIARQLESSIMGALPVNLDDAQPPRLSAEDIAWARRYPWPGNIRQLKHAIALWVFHEGRLPLGEVVSVDMPVQDLESAGNGEGAIDAYLLGRLEQALGGRLPPPGSPKALLKEVNDEARAALVRWLDATQPSDLKIHRLFPEYKSVRSLRNKLSQWRGR